MYALYLNTISFSDDILSLKQGQSQPVDGQVREHPRVH